MKNIDVQKIADVEEIKGDIDIELAPSWDAIDTV